MEMRYNVLVTGLAMLIAGSIVGTVLVIGLFVN